MRCSNEPKNCKNYKCSFIKAINGKKIEELKRLNILLSLIAKE
jgi:hypothetical protein